MREANAMGTGSGKGLSFDTTLGATRTSPNEQKAPSTLAEPDFMIGRSLGARALNYDVKEPRTGKVYHFAEGTTISHVEVFAGKGVATKLRPRVVNGLVSRYGGRANQWQHAKGIGTIERHGIPRTAEVHWFQESSVGKCEFKIKRWLS